MLLVNGPNNDQDQTQGNNAEESDEWEQQLDLLLAFLRFDRFVLRSGNECRSKLVFILFEYLHSWRDFDLVLEFGDFRDLVRLRCWCCSQVIEILSSNAIDSESDKTK